MKLISTTVTVAESRIRTLIAASVFAKKWIIYMHPIVSLDGGWFMLAGADRGELRQIWLAGGSSRALFPRTFDAGIWSIWNNIADDISLIPTAIIHDIESGNALIIHVIETKNLSKNSLRAQLMASNVWQKEMSSLCFVDDQLLNEPDDVLAWISRGFLSLGKSSIVMSSGKAIQVAA